MKYACFVGYLYWHLEEVREWGKWCGQGPDEGVDVGSEMPGRRKRWRYA